MPFFRENLDDQEVCPPVAEAQSDAGSRPVLIHGLGQIRRQEPSRPLGHRASEESIRTDLCEGPLPDAPRPKSRSPEPELCVTTTSDRAELIERLKRGESPTWVPTRRLDSFFPREGSRDRSPSPRPKSRGSPGLLTASIANDDMNSQSQEVDNAERMQQGLTIERPRSALHSGDFTQNIASSRYGEVGKQHRRTPDAEVFGSDRQSSWFATSPPRDYTPLKRIPFPDLPDGYRSSPPSLSSSLSSSFVYKHPTSPLVQSESNDDLNINAMDLDASTPSRAPRRQTLHTFHSSQTIPITAQRIPSVRRESTFPYQAHQPRRSLTSAPAVPWMASSLQTYPHGSRRPSVALDSSSPLQQTSMVGSYEESILRGRMSTTPSKPLDFLAQIGVLGLGNCKSSLRCPAHVTLPFPAVFYSYASTPHGRSTSDDGPSPYVGQVDLENGLPNPEDSRARRRSHQRSGSTSAARRSRAGSVDVEMAGVDGSGPDARGVAKQRRRGGGSPKAPPGGSYRIPEKGQIQIIIKNQNKTAVKLFLVPYDLAGMEPGTKTFIRQRSYSGGPVVDAVPDASSTQTAEDHPVLRYLAHLHICCPARGRYYLYKSIRVVFANRVPDGKEKLRNEITLPEPRWTPYKAVRQMHIPATQQATGPGASLAAEKAFRRRSSGFSFGQMGGFDGPTEPVPALPAFDLRQRALSVQDRGGTVLGGPADVPSLPSAGFATLKFAKGEVAAPGGGGHMAGSLAGASSAAVAEGLLSQRLRLLGMHGVCRGEAVDGEVDGANPRQ